LSRQLEGEARCGERSGAGAPGRHLVTPGADPAGHRQLLRDGDGASGRLATGRSRLSELGSLIPAERQALACLIEVVPEGAFVTYGLGVSFSKLRDPAAARAHVPVTPEGRTR
jgi:hypothetical protein